MTLAAQITADLDTFFDVSGFAVSASYVHGTTTTSIAVLFDKPYLENELAAAVGIESNRPTCRAKTSDVANAAHGDTLTINAITYTVVGVQPDGNGVSTLILRAP